MLPYLISADYYWKNRCVSVSVYCVCVCVQEGFCRPPGHGDTLALPVVLYLGLTPSPLQAQEGGGVKEEWTVGHLQPSSLTWLDHLALPVAQ